MQARAVVRLLTGMLVPATLAGFAGCKDPTQFRVLLTSSACPRLTSLEVEIDGVDGGASLSRDGGLSCGGDGGTELGDIVILPGPVSRGARQSVVLRARATLPGGSCTRGTRARCIEAARSLKFDGDRELTIALEAECADVDCNASRPAGAVERTCVVKEIGRLRVPVCAQADCDGGACEESEAGVADTGAPR